MIEVPATEWRAIALALLLWVTAESSLADPTEVPPGSLIDSDDVLPGPVLDTSLLKSHRKDDAWLKQGFYIDAARGPELDDHLLDPILEALTLPEMQTELSFWEKLEDWLNRHLGDRPTPVLPDWLRSFRLPEDTILWVFYVSCALIVMLAIGIVGNEIRHARGRRKSACGCEKSGREEDARGTNVLASSADRGRASRNKPDSVLELPAWLLGRLIARLGLSLSGTRGDSLTHRELVLAGARLPGEVAQPLAALARTAERIRYDAGAPDETEISAAVREGTVLLESLEGRG